MFIVQVSDSIGRVHHVSVTATEIECLAAGTGAVPSSRQAIGICNHDDADYIYVLPTDGAEPVVDATHHLVAIAPGKTEYLAVGLGIDVWLASSGTALATIVEFC